MRYSILGGTEALIQQLGGINIKSTRSSGIVFADLTTGQVSALKAAGCVVALVDKVKTGTIGPPPPITGVATYTTQDILTLANIDAFRNITTPPLYGDGINVAVIGTGIRETHEQIAGMVVHSKNYTIDTMADGFDHDTGVASIIATIAPHCGILNLKVLDNTGEGSEEDVVLALDDCATWKFDDETFAPHVINLSLGGPDDGDANDILRVACRACIAAGIFVYAAAGNSGPQPTTITTPASEQYVIAVGAVGYIPNQETFAVGGFSSRGPTLDGKVKPDAVFFGENLIMASSKADDATVAKSGTSFSCPMAAGIGILYIEGVNTQAQTKVQLGQLPPQAFYSMPINVFVDTYLPKVCVKPLGIALAKDNAYGSGLPYGPLLTSSLIPTPTSSSIDISSMMGMMMAMMMMGMVMKMTNSNTGTKAKAK